MFKNIDHHPMALLPITESLIHDCDVSVFDEVTSTNERALQLFRERACVPFACFAEAQTQGRGRRGNAWLSPPGSNIYMSLGWRFSEPLNELSVLALMIAMAVVKVLESMGVAGVGIKWPNDVQVNGEKIAGILIETSSFSSQHADMVIGVGLNYDLPEYVKKLLPEQTTDICTQRTVVMQGERNAVAGLLLNECIQICQSYIDDREKLMQHFRSEYDVCTGKVVGILQGSGEQLEGKVLGVADNGELRVDINGEEQMFNSAEISLRK